MRFGRSAKYWEAVNAELLLSSPQERLTENWRGLTQIRWISPRSTEFRLEAKSGCGLLRGYGSLATGPQDTFQTFEDPDFLLNSLLARGFKTSSADFCHSCLCNSSAVSLHVR